MKELRDMIDARQDILCCLGKVTDKMVDSMCKDSVEASYLLSKAYKNLANAESLALDSMNHDNCVPYGIAYCEDWGDTDMEAKALFEKLERHYRGYQKAKGKHRKTRCAESKKDMLEHLKHLMPAHGELSEYVKSHCTDCVEERAIVMEWVASSK